MCRLWLFLAQWLGGGSIGQARDGCRHGRSRCWGRGVCFDRQRFALGLPRIAQRLDRLDGLFAFGVDLAADHARDLVPDVIDIDGLVPVGGETAGLLRSAEQVGLI